MAFTELRYFSQALGKHTAANALLPETGDAPFPVLYLLHGLSDDHTAWCRNTSIERYVSDVPLIVVMPDGGRGFYLDAKEGFAYETALFQELPDRIERTFPAQKTRSGRAVAGLSMGGYGAIHTALAHPDRFCAAASLSGALGWGHYPLDWNGRSNAPEWRRILGDDFAGGNADMWHLASALAPDALPALRFDCGVDDHLVRDNREFAAFLAEKNITHEYVEYPGAHNWAYWDAHIEQAIAFLTRAMEAAPAPTAV